MFVKAFVHAVKRNFCDLLSLLTKQPEYKKFLMDKGVGSPPVRYLIAVEAGLRAYADDIHAMGTRPLRSPHYWSKVDLWRKREAYIAVVRHVLSNDASYHHWTSFLFSDYVQRQTSALTFTRRHLPLSNGDDQANFNGKYFFKWINHIYIPRKKTKNNKEKSKVKPSATSVTPASTAGGIMVYDVEEGRMVCV